MKSNKIKIGDTVYLPAFSRWINVTSVSEKRASGKSGYIIKGKSGSCWIGQEFKETTNIKTR